MGIQERRERERQELKVKILDAARDLFVRDGYEAVSMRKIAQRIEYSPTAIYSYFKDKKSLLQELCHTDFFGLGERFHELALIEDPVERLHVLGRAYVEFGLRYPQHYRFMLMTEIPLDFEPDPRYGDPRFDAYAALRVAVQAAMEAGRLRPELQDADLVAQTLWAGLHGVISLHLARGGDPWVPWKTYEERAEFMFGLLVHGILRGEEALP